MTLLASLAAANHRPSRVVYVGGQTVEPVSIEVELTIDGISSAATIELASVPNNLNFRDNVRVDLGYDGFLSTVFTGEVEDDGRGYFPFTNTLKGVGPLHLAQYQYGAQVNYTAQTDLQIVTDLLNVRAGITRYDLDSDGTTLGVVQDVVLRAGETPFSLVNQVDQLFGYYTFDCPDGVVRRRLITGIPALSPSFVYTQGDPGSGEYRVFRVSRPRTVRGIHNKVVVTGLPQPTFTPSDSRQAANAYVPTPPTYYAYSFDSELIETNAVAQAVSLRLMTEVNRILEEIEIEVPGNPFLVPGITTVGLKASQVGLGTTTPFFLKGVRHTFNDQGFTSTLTLQGGVGDAGYELSKPPEPCFSIIVTRETWGGTTYYTTACDASCTTDPDSALDTLTYAWSNNENSDTGTATVYYTAFTAAQLNTGTAAITLVATDPDANSGTISQFLDGTANVVIARVTADIATNTSQFEATPDGGSVWNVYAVSAAKATPEIGGASAQHFGAGTALYSSADYLTTAPTEIHDFGGTITSIWVNEVDANRMTVGLDTGAVAVTANAGDGTAATWATLVTFTDPIQHVVESSQQNGQYWVATGDAVWLTFDAFGAKAQRITATASTATARHIALSGFGNYACFTGGGGSLDCCKREDGVSIVPSDGAADIYTITHHIRDDILYGAGVSGTSTVIYATSPGGTLFDPIGTIDGGGTPHRLLRDGDNPGVLYLAHDAALSKTYDGGYNWVTLRSGNGPYLQVGYGSAPLVPPTQGGTLWVGTGSGLYRRLAAGGYSQVNASVFGFVYHLSSPFGFPLVVYVIAQDKTNGGTKTLFRSTDGGATWTSISATLPVTTSSIVWFGATDSDENTIHLSASVGQDQASSGVYKSTDQGATWSMIANVPDSTIVAGISSFRQVGTRIWFTCPFEVGKGWCIQYGGADSFLYTHRTWDAGGPWLWGIRGDPTRCFVWDQLGAGALWLYEENSDIVYTSVSPSGYVPGFVAAKSTGTAIMTASTPSPGNQPTLLRAASYLSGDWSVVAYGDAGLGNQAGANRYIDFDDATGDWWFGGGQTAINGAPWVYRSTDDGLTWTKEQIDLPGSLTDCVCLQVVQ